MNLRDAILSGRRFRRVSSRYKYWHRVENKRIIFHGSTCDHESVFDADEILADDWELEPEPEPEQKKELSWKEIKNAFMVATPAIWQLSPYERDLKARLGFKK